MVEQLKLLRRPLPPKLPSKLSTPREKVGKDSHDAPDGNSVEDVWQTNFHFIASKQDEEEKLMSRSQVEVLCCFLYQKIPLSLQEMFFSILETLDMKTLFHATVQLFLLEDLEYLDVAYNGISFIPNDIKNLRKLKCLNIEENQFCALPSGILKLPLKFLRIENNFIHPLLWNEKFQNQPQKLIHLAALCFSRSNLKERYTDITEDIKKILDDFTVCDCCSGPRYGKGLWLV